jgi:hypothetical protein
MQVPAQERSSNHLLNFFRYYFKYDLARRRAEPNGATRRATYGSLSSRFAMALICAISIAIAAQALIYSGLIFMSGKLFPTGLTPIYAAANHRIIFALLQ